MVINNKNDPLVAALGEVMQADLQGRSPWAAARQRFLRNRAAVFSLLLLVVIALACLLGPWLLPHAFDSTDWQATTRPQPGPTFTGSELTIPGVTCWCAAWWVGASL